MSRRHALALCASLLATGAGSCDLESPVERGQALFTSTRTGQSGAFAPYSCAFCHDLTDEAPDGLRRPGAPLHDVARRAAFWGGTRRTLRDATNLCITSYMRGISLLPDSSDWYALRAYLESISTVPSGTAALPISMPRDCAICPTKGCDACAPEAGGDALAGQTVYAQACAMCHGDYDSSSKPVPNAPALKKGERHIFIAGTREDDADNTRPHIAGKIRFGNFGLFGVPPAKEDFTLPPGTLAHVSAVPNMPLYVKERLSPAELADLFAYLFPEAP